MERGKAVSQVAEPFRENMDCPCEPSVGLEVSILVGVSKIAWLGSPHSKAILRCVLAPAVLSMLSAPNGTAGDGDFILLGTIPGETQIART